MRPRGRCDPAGSERGRAPQRGALRGPSCDEVRQAFGAGALGVRARLTRAEVLLAGAFFAAAGVTLRAGALAGAGFSADRTVDFAESAVPSLSLIHI